MVLNNTSYRHRGKTRNRFFRRPRLKIQYDENRFPAIYVPQRTYVDTQVSRTYLRVYVKNFGGEPARDCEARLITIPTVKQPYPAIQEVVLGWEGSVDGVNDKIESNKDIEPKSRQLVHIVYSDSSFPARDVKPPEPKHAVIASTAALTDVRPRIVENGYSSADYVIRISITSESASTSCSEYFRLHVDNRWNKLSMRKLTWLEKRRIRDLS